MGFLPIEEERDEKSRWIIGAKEKKGGAGSKYEKVERKKKRDKGTFRFPALSPFLFLRSILSHPASHSDDARISSTYS